MTQGSSAWTPILTDRLQLRRPCPGDRDAAIRIHSDPRTNRHHPAPETISVNSSAARFESICEHWSNHGFGVWTVVLRSDPDTVVGFTGLTYRTVHGRDVLNLYYRYDPSVWGRGYASEGARCAVRLANRLLSTFPVVAYTTPDNIGSQRTALAAGLTRHEELDIDNGRYTDIYLAQGW
ncbi:GNAT family N-acetyltransferase [Paramicrobacterium chengjingii]|uniref:GNAT family N-acetyltransferase n=1 Tax=Paramicrobacterium chengjingii TaxID=2769067 RepID=UPI00331302DB